MNRISLPTTLALLLCGGVLVLAHSTGAQTRDTPKSVQAAKDEIARINREITSLVNTVSTRSKERDALQRQLRDTDTAIEEASQGIEQTQVSLDKRGRTLTTIEAETRVLARDVAARQTQLEDAVGAFSILRQGGELQILLGDSTAHETERHRAYFDILLTEQLNEIDAFKDAIFRLEAKQRELSDIQQIQRAERDELAQQRASLRSERAQQTQVIADLSALLVRDGTQIDALRADSERLNTVLIELTRRMADLPLNDRVDDFSTLAGKLQPPLAGKSDRRFGEKRKYGDLRWQGWLIPAQRGAPVRAIHYGRVVYADWLRGQGLLTIVDHGDGWMSLYGRNESLLKEAGDWVAPGEEIARAGSSGGATEPALYFEIRSQGVPVDPAIWIQ